MGTIGIQTVSGLDPFDRGTLRNCNDYFLISQYNDTTYVSKRLTYTQLWSSLSVDVYNIIPPDTVQTVSTAIPNSHDSTKAYNTTSTNTAYNAINSRCSAIEGNVTNNTTAIEGRLGKTISTKQTVTGPVEFTGQLQAKTSDGSNTKDVVNVAYLNSHMSTSFFVDATQDPIKSWSIAKSISAKQVTKKLETVVNGVTYKLNVKVIEGIDGNIPTASTPYTATQDCMVTYWIYWTCKKTTSYGCFIQAPNSTKKLLYHGVPAVSSIHLSFQGSLLLKSGYKIWFGPFTEDSANYISKIEEAHITVLKLA